MTRLSSPLPDLSPSLPPDEDPLAFAFNRAYSPSSSMGSLSEETVWGLLSLMNQVEFDPNAVLPSRNNLPILSGVINGINPFSNKNRLRKWPLSAEDFNQDLLTPFTNDFDQPGWNTVDAEWLAAILVACGADPWIDCGRPSGYRSDHGKLGSALHGAMRVGAVGLATRLWAVEKGRPDVSVLATHLLEHPQNPTKSKGTWLEWAVQGDNKELVGWLLDLGVRPLDDRPHPLEQTFRADMVDAFLARGLLQKESPEIQRLQKTWRARLRNQKLSAEQLVALEQAVATEDFAQENQDQNTTQAEMESILSRAPWESAGQYNPARLPNKVPLERLFDEVTLPTGPLAGQWTRLAAPIAGPFSLEKLIGSQHSIDHAPLKPALGRQWRPDVSLDGLLALAVLGMSDDKNDLAPASTPLSNSQAFLANAYMLGIHQVGPWADQHRKAAITLTESMLQNRASPGAYSRLQKIWSMALKRHPLWLKGHPEEAVQLIQALNKAFMNHDLIRQMDPDTGVTTIIFDRSSAMGNVIASAWPDLAQGIPDLKNATPSERSLALEVGLLVHDRNWLEALENAAAQKLWSHDDRKRIQQFEKLARRNVASSPKNWTYVLAMTRGMLLEQRLPAPSQVVSKPRF